MDIDSIVNKAIDQVDIEEQREEGIEKLQRIIAVLQAKLAVILGGGTAAEVAKAEPGFTKSTKVAGAVATVTTPTQPVQELGTVAKTAENLGLKGDVVQQGVNLLKGMFGMDEEIDYDQMVNGVAYQLDDGRVIALNEEGVPVEIVPDELYRMNVADDDEIDYDEFEIDYV
jgi:hypothetical protein